MKTIALSWVYHKEDNEWIARVPAQDRHGAGFFIIHAIGRPGHCDRGRYYVLVESEVVAPLDDQEGFPRYFFKLGNLIDEMTAWANARQEVRDALNS